MDDALQKLERKREKARERGRRYRERHPERVRELALARRKKWVAENPIGWRSAQWKYHYGIDADKYRQMLEDQGGNCAICQKPPTKKLLHVDHDHETGAVRGLLCRDCNLAIGHFKDSEDSMQRAVQYLREHAATITHG